MVDPSWSYALPCKYLVMDNIPFLSASSGVSLLGQHPADPHHHIIDSQLVQVGSFIVRAKSSLKLQNCSIRQLGRRRGIHTARSSSGVVCILIPARFSSGVVS
jgi:hypothetical protein